MDRQEYIQKTDMFYAEMLEFIMSKKELFSKMAMYEKLFDYPGLDEAQRKSRCLDWFVFDYREAEGPRSVLDMFLEQAEVEPDKRGLCEGFKNNVYSVFEVKAVKMGKEALLVDFFRGAEHQVTDTTFTRHVQKGDLCVIRILPFETIKIIADDGYLFPRETSAFIRINREKFGNIKGGLTPLDVVRMFYGSDKSSNMEPKEKLLYLAGKAGISEKKTEYLIEKMKKEAAGTGDPMQIIQEFIGSTEKPGREDMEKIGKAAIDYWNSLINKPGVIPAKGPVEKALLELAFSRFSSIINDEKEKNPQKAQAKIDEWFKAPLAVIDGKTPEQAVLEERKELGNPEKRVHYSFNMQMVRHPEFEKAEKEAEELFNTGIEYMKKNNYRKAIGVFKKYNEIWNKNPVVHYNMAVCSARLGDYKSAKVSLKTALKIDPAYKKAKDAMSDLEKYEKESEKLKKDKKKKSGKILQFYVALNHAEPKIWRRIEVPDGMGLRTFAVAILLAMGWKNSHLHEFIIDGESYGMTGEEMDYIDEALEPEDETEYKLSDFTSKQLKNIEFLYDFGDGWEHEVSLENTREPEKGVFYPRCTDGGRNCPPEDCGGIGGYEGLIENLKDTDSEERDSLIAWLGGNYDPEFFDTELVNYELTKTDAYERCGFEDDESARDIIEESEYKNCGIGTREDLNGLKNKKARPDRK